MTAQKAAEAFDSHRKPTTYSQGEACYALGAIGPSSDVATPLLLETAARTEGVVPVATCIDTLLRVGREADVLTLLGRSPPTAAKIRYALAARKRAVTTILPALIDELKSSRRSFPPSEVCWALHSLGVSASAAVPELKRRAAAQVDLPFQLDLVMIILAISPTDADALKVIESALADPKEKDEAMEILAVYAAPTSWVLARLEERLAAGATNGTVIFGIARCGAAAKGAVSDLVKFAGHTEETNVNARQSTLDILRRASVLALGRIGPDAAAAVPALTALRDKGDETIRVPAAQALRRIRAKK